MNAIVPDYSKHIAFALNVKATLVSQILGSQPSASVAGAYVRSRAIERITEDLRREGTPLTKARQMAEAQVAQEADMTSEEQDEEPIQLTVFHRDEVGVYLMDYQIRGFLREAAETDDIKVPAKAKGKTKSGKTDVKRNVWVFPAQNPQQRKIYFMRDGKPLAEADTILDRPKRVSNPRTGQDVSTISASEIIYTPDSDPTGQVKEPTMIEFNIAVLRHSGVTQEQVVDLLTYGGFMGLGQWRTGGHGRFIVELKEIDPGDIPISSFMLQMAANQ